MNYRGTKQYDLKHLFTNRLSQIIFSTLKSLSPLLVNFTLSVIVIRYYSEDLWGSLSQLVLVINLLLLLTSWSNKEYLLRKFSTAPGLIKEAFWNIFFTRLLILLPIIFIYILWYRTNSFIVLPALLILLLRFINNSFEPIYTYFKKFRLTLAADLIALSIAIGLVFYFENELNLKWLCWILAIIETIKLFWYITFLNRELFYPKKITIEFKFFLQSAPFFAVGIISFMQSKSDQFLINYFLSDAEKAIYQVLTNLLMLLIALPSFIVGPFIKNIYRMKQQTLDAITRKLFLLGCILTPIGVTGVSIVLRYLYKIELPIVVYLLSTFYVLPVFYFSLKIYGIFKKREDKKAATIIFIAFLVSTGSGFFLIPRYGISGGLCASILGQLAIIAMISFSELKINRTR
jgi:O-antigen/teichoic acid export membrane protein